MSLRALPRTEIDPFASVSLLADEHREPPERRARGTRAVLDDCIAQR
jgi:hypothetical protein